MAENRKKRVAQEEIMKQRQEGQLIPPPRPEWPFEQCKAAGICSRWMRRGVCLLKDCQWKHQIPEEGNAPAAQAQCNMFGQMDLFELLGKRLPSQFWID